MSKIKEVPCADGCKREVNESNGWQVKIDDSKSIVLICTSCHYTRGRKA